MAERRKWKWEEHAAELNEVERLKLKKDGLDVIQDIYRWAKSGYESIPEEDFVRLKWAGIYQQRPKDGHFMMRVRIPSGLLNSRQVRVLAELARDYGRGLIDVTTRQSVQYHWLRIEHIPDMFRRLEEVGLHPYEACGDCPRNIVGNPLAGIDPHELIDTRPIVEELERTFLLNREFSNLPRKVQNFRLVQRLQRDERPDPRPRLHAGGQGDRRKKRRSASTSGWGEASPPVRTWRSNWTCLFCRSRWWRWPWA